MTRPAPRFRIALALTAALLAARALAAAPLTDPLGSPLPVGLHLHAPALYLVLGPLFSIWDGASMLSMTRLHGFLLGTALLYLLWRLARVAFGRTGPFRPLHELAVLGASLAGFALFLALGLLWHRPMLALAGAGPDRAVVDFHSHTNVSHDVRGTLMSGFDVRANLAWHRRAGFDAVFVTDHNTIAPAVPAGGLPLRCPGLEVSAWRAHIVLLGDTLPVDRGPYSRDWTGLARLLAVSDSAYHARSVASLPEYENNHWERLDSLVASGLDGFEIVNASPKANELSRARRDSVVSLARRSGRFVVGVSDHHGWGATSMVWNLVPAAAWRANPSTLCGRILDRLDQGVESVQIVERHRLRADSAWPSLLTPLGVVWETWRGMPGLLTLSWLVWIWGIPLAMSARGRGRRDIIPPPQSRTS
ncbi:MAG TPA: hypothetical protein VJQ44_05135 [Gemmatimonadales bacterium]|nr:hypothetical protein [Gemmatimonadales bacterium]